MVHVYRCPLLFKTDSGQEDACFFMCSCMPDIAWQTLKGTCTTNGSFKSWCDTLNPCQHSHAIKWLHDQGYIPFGSSVDPSPNMFNDIPFSSTSHPVTVLQTSPRLILSCGFSKKRGIIFTEKSIYKCYTCPKTPFNCIEHMKPFSNWILQDQVSDYGDVFDGYCLHTQRNILKPEDSEEQSDRPPSCVSWKPIKLDFQNESMKCRAQSIGKLHLPIFSVSKI